MLGLTIILLAACAGETTVDNTEAEDVNDANKRDQQFELRIATVVSPPHPWFDLAEHFQKEVEKRTDGAVTVSLHHSGTLGNDETIMEQVQRGEIDLIISGTQNATTFVPRLQIFGLAYLFENMDHFERVIAADSEVHQYFVDEFAAMDIDVKLLALSGGGTRYLSNSKGEIATLDDLKGLTMRLPESPIENEIWTSLGAKPKILSWNDLYKSVQSGEIDGFESTFSGYMSSKLYEVAPYVSLTEHVYMTTHFSMSEKSYEKLPKAYQEIIDEVAIEAAEIATEKGKEFDESLLEVLQDRGVTLTEVDRDSFINTLQPLHEDLATKLELTSLLKMIQDLE